MSLLCRCETLYGTTDLYKLLCINRSAKESEIKRAYYKLSLEVHPDRVKEAEKEAATQKFQVLGKVYTILSDAEKRAVYDETGEIDEENLIPENRDWDQYWRLLFKKITVKDIKEFEQKYKGSSDELDDLKQTYQDGEGDMDYILNNVLCASVEDVERYEEIISKWIGKKEVKAFAKFTKQTKKQREARKRKAAKEASEAETAMKEIGMDDTEASLRQMILKKGQQREAAMDSLLDSLAAKYGSGGKKGKKSKTKT